MKTVSILLLSSLFIFSCRKKEDPTVTVLYQVIEKTGNASAFTVTYRDEKQTLTRGPINASSWGSPYVKKKNGEHVSFTVQPGSSGGNFEMTLYVNGKVWATHNFSGPAGAEVIEGDLFW